LDTGTTGTRPGEVNVDEVCGGADQVHVTAVCLDERRDEIATLRH
jgi:hypothetical protein